MKTINFNVLPEQMKKATDKISPVDVEYFLVLKTGTTEAGMMDDQGGRLFFGDNDWELLLDGFHPDHTAARIGIEIH